MSITYTADFTPAGFTDAQAALLREDLGEDTVQALQAVISTIANTSSAAAVVPAFGLTAARPLTPVTGQFFFDTTLGKPIWWSGAAWVLADGTPNP